ncbi:MAG: hypothetical protein R3C49_09140 [Planctomycetaceae bacterium]
MSRRFRFCLVVWVAVVAGTVLVQNAPGQDTNPVPTEEIQPVDESPMPMPMPTGDQPMPDGEPMPLPPADETPAVISEQPQPAPIVVEEFPMSIPMDQGYAPYAIVDDGEWVMDIRPAAKAVTSAAAPPIAIPQTAPSATCEGCGRLQASAADYARIYASIPFNRAEYNANPTYRHDATMEILTGNARHQTIVRHDSRPAAVAAPARQAIGFNPYAYGYLRPALRLNYYRYFPSLNPYVNIWNLSGAY